MGKKFCRGIALLLCSVALLGTTACGKQTPTPDGDGTSTAPEGGTYWTTGEEIKETDELVIWEFPYMENVTYKDFLPDFKKKFPNVNITIEKFDDLKFDDFVDMLENELLAGRGPDLILWDNTSSHLRNINKFVEAGVFYNLDLFIQTDPEFDMNAYSNEFFDAGYKNGARYYVPLSYSVSYVVASQENLDREDIDLYEGMGFGEFSEEVMRYCQRIAGGERRLHRWGRSFFTFYSCGYNVVNYATGNINVDTPEFRVLMELVREIYIVLDKPINDGILPWWDMSAEFINGSALLENGDVLYENSDTMYFPPTYRDMLKEKDMTPVIIAIPSATGGRPPARLQYCAGIRNTSKNKKNAYELLKLYLSDKVQPDEYYIRTGVPVNLRVLDGLLAKYAAVTEWTDGTVYKLRPEDVDLFKRVLTNVDFYEYSGDMNRLAYEKMEPYFNGDASYDDCLVELKDGLARLLRGLD